MEKLIYSTSPHVKSKNTTKRIMLDVVIALLPACVVGVVYFGWRAAVTLIVACLAACAAELAYKLCQKKSFKTFWKEFDFTSCVTGLLIGMNMYQNTPFYVPALASVFAVVVVKMLFGGTGRNVVNPAIAGRIFATISFGPALGASMSDLPSIGGISGGSVTAGATALGALLTPDKVTCTLSTFDLLLGTGVAGTIGETCKIALLLGGIYLVVRKVVDFRWPLVYIVVCGAFSVLMNYFVNDAFEISVLWTSVLSGGLILGAVFMATDYVTTPNTKIGNYVYFVLLGLLTAAMRYLTQGEAVSYCILLMNLFVPLIDKYITRRPFGYVKEKTVKEGK